MRVFAPEIQDQASEADRLPRTSLQRRALTLTLPSPLEGEGSQLQNPLAISGSGAVFSLRIIRLLRALT